jgi:hypothetical protein
LWEVKEAYWPVYQPTVYPVVREALLPLGVYCPEGEVSIAELVLPIYGKMGEEVLLVLLGICYIVIICVVKCNGNICLLHPIIRNT